MKTLEQFVKENKEAIATAVNDYTLANNIKFSEFNEEQQHRLKINLAAVVMQEMI